MQEIEIKFRIDNREQLISKLESHNSHFSDPIHQKDIIFVPDLNDTANGEGKIFVRIRKQNEKKIITLKNNPKSLCKVKKLSLVLVILIKLMTFWKPLDLKNG